MMMMMMIVIVMMTIIVIMVDSCVVHRLMLISKRYPLEANSSREIFQFKFHADSIELIGAWCGVVWRCDVLWYAVVCMFLNVRYRLV